MNELDTLKDILFRDERQALDDLAHRVQTPETRAADIADVLPEAIVRSFEEDPRFARALQAPFEQSLRTAIRRSPKTFADALFPVIGPAIRRAIAEAMKAMVQSINYAVETGLSPRRQIMWRFEAMRAGIPLGEYVLQKTLRYRVEHVYLIHRESGLLIAHEQHLDAHGADSDAVSAMFTAIQDFMKDSFAVDQTGGLETAELGRFTLWSVTGPDAVIACVIRGVPPRSLRTELSEVTERIHLRYADALKEFDGDTSRLAGVDAEIEECLRFEARAQKREGENDVRKMLPSIAFVVVLTVLLSWLGWRQYVATQELNTVRTIMRETPGVLATEVVRKGKSIQVYGLRDPLAATPATLEASAGLEKGRLWTELHPYQSLEPAMIVVRARAGLQPPDSVELLYFDGNLIGRGTAPVGWASAASDLALVIGGVTSVDFSAIRVDDESLRQAAREALQPPPGVDLIVSAGVLNLNGTAPAAWIKRAEQQANSLDGLLAVQMGGLQPEELAQLHELARAAATQEIRFEGGDRLAEGAEKVLADLAVTLTRLGVTAEPLALSVEVTLLGDSDGYGSRELNEDVRRARAERVRSGLVALGVKPGILGIGNAGEVTGGGEVDKERRRVKIDVRVRDSEGKAVMSQ